MGDRAPIDFFQLFFDETSSWLRQLGCLEEEKEYLDKHPHERGPGYIPTQKISIKERIKDTCRFFHRIPINGAWRLECLLILWMVTLGAGVCTPTEGSSTTCSNGAARLMGKGYLIFTDNFHSSPTLFKELPDNGFKACWTTQIDCMGILSSVRQTKL